MTTARTATLARRTRETDIRGEIRLDGAGRADISTGLAFFDHLLTALARHSGIDLTLTCDGDLEIDDHHTIEDCSLVLGSLIDLALGERRGIARFGSAYAPLDEALARAVVDLSGRPCSVVLLGLVRPMIGAVACENIGHAVASLSTSLRAAIHLDVLRGDNDHHRAEAAFKALALAIRQAITLTGGDEIPSTKGTL
ncbi:MAG: imidazoleglycerol-phosphate dehydratase HisB [Phycisphaerales bacterium]|nr:imidazoleglycerol-phosphate dehydratase HisB [Phycisphaerales bacterium]